MSRWRISGATVLTPDESITGVNVIIQDKKIDSITKNELKTSISLNVENGVLTPGLINAHDHLLGTYFPKVGNGPYENWLPWDNDLKSSPVYIERQQIENRDLYLLGGYRNLISGITCVSDHIPHFVNEPYIPILQVKVLKDYALSHSIASFALVWGDSIEKEYKKALDKDIPFITHISEGFDPETIQDVSKLEQKGGLGDHSVLVHGLAFSDEDINLIKKRKASVVWCADSNMFMFDKTTNIELLLEKGVNVCIGTDSPMSGGENILSEMKYDKNLFYSLYNKQLPNDVILKMVTSNPAKAFRLKDTGQIKPGYIADLVLFSNREKDPYSSVVSAELKDVLLVIINGKPVYGSIEYKDLFDSFKIKYQNFRIKGEEKILAGDLVGLLKRIENAIGMKKEFPFLPIEFS